MGGASAPSRLRTNAPVVAPRRWNESSAVRFENPPTKKKIGITWKNHVASQSQAVTPTALVVRMTPSCHQMTPMNQWPKTTATMLAARRKSTTRSRLGGVRAARSPIAVALIAQGSALAAGRSMTGHGELLHDRMTP
jgi:hypothetical protein